MCFWARLLSPRIKWDFFPCHVFQTDENHSCLSGPASVVLNALVWVYSSHRMNQLCQLIRVLPDCKPWPTHNTHIKHSLLWPLMVPFIPARPASIMLSVTEEKTSSWCSSVRIHTHTHTLLTPRPHPQQVTIGGLTWGLLSRTRGQYLSISDKAKLLACLAGHEKTDLKVFIFPSCSCVVFQCCLHAAVSSAFLRQAADETHPLAL